VKQSTAILGGDSLQVGKEGCIEVSVPGGSFLRLARDGEVEVVSYEPSVVFRGSTGSFYIQRLARGRGELMFESPLCKVAPTPDSMVRVDILANGTTTVYRTVGPRGGSV